jgi:predicted aspartyl protease
VRSAKIRTLTPKKLTARPLRTITLCALAVAGKPGLAAQCTMTLLADIPLTMQHNQPLIAASINGRPVNMLLDTGATKTILFRAWAKELNLPISPIDMKAYGVDGQADAGIVMVRDFGLSRAMVHKLQMLAVGGKDAPVSAAGLLGEDVVSNWDLDMDFSAGKVRLFQPKDCKGEQVISIWGATSYSVLPLVAPPPDTRYLWAHVQINGRQVLAMFDTGAGRSVVTTQALQRLGLTPETQTQSAGALHGVASRGLKTSGATFASMSIGQESIQNVELNISDLFSRNKAVMSGSAIPQNIMDNPDILIGADFFLAHHAYVARSQGKIYFSYKGGPIFQHDRPKDPDTKDSTPSIPSTPQQ